ncbi:MAG: chromate transporter, partial [Clostridia bacterium]|nr:chromate transporter [Clostridia bacterium]
SELLNFLAVSESTPGPIAVNMATFIGSSQGGIFGALVATVGVVLPAFLIMLCIVAFVRGFLQAKLVQAAMSGIRPAVIGLILSTAAILFLSAVLGVGKITDGFSVNWMGFIILAVVVAVAETYQHFRKKKISPILLILLSAVLGGILYSF